MPFCSGVSRTAYGVCTRLRNAGNYVKAAAQTIPFAIGKIKDAGVACSAKRRALDASITGVGAAIALTPSTLLKVAGMFGVGTGALRAWHSPHPDPARLSFAEGAGVAAVAAGLAARTAVGSNVALPLMTGGSHFIVYRTVSALPRPVRELAAHRFAAGFFAGFTRLPGALSVSLLGNLYLRSRPEGNRWRWVAEQCTSALAYSGAAGLGFAVAGPIGAVAASAGTGALLSTAGKMVSDREVYLAPIAAAFRENLRRLQNN